MFKKARTQSQKPLPDTGAPALNCTMPGITCGWQGNVAWLQVSVLPRCGRVAAVLEAPSLPAAAAAFGAAALDMASAIFMESYLSLTALVFLLLLSFGFARAGGVGAVPTVPAATPSSRSDTLWTTLAQR